MKEAVKQAVSRTRESFLAFGSPLIGEAEIEEVVATLRSGWIGTGPRVARFEEGMKSYTGAAHAVAVNSCTAALHLSLVALGIGPGDEVITTPMTFVATANAIIHAGARPVFADVDRATMLIDPGEIERLITPRTKAVIPVHLAGRPCAMDKIMAIARKHGLYVIEDAAHAIEARYRGRSIGGIGDLTCFSFYVTKNLTTGEGGMVTTNNSEWAARIRIRSLHGMDLDAHQRFTSSGYKHYQVVEPGYKYNMTDMQAALGIHQLARLEDSWLRRDEIWQQYQENFSDLPLHLPAAGEQETRHARHLYTVQAYAGECGASRDQLLDSLAGQKIGAGVHYTPVHLHPYYRKAFGYREGAYPHAEWIGAGTLSLPLTAKLTNRDVEDVIAAVRHGLEA